MEQENLHVVHALERLTPSEILPIVLLVGLYASSSKPKSPVFRLFFHHEVKRTLLFHVGTKISKLLISSFATPACGTVQHTPVFTRV